MLNRHVLRAISPSPPRRRHALLQHACFESLEPLETRTLLSTSILQWSGGPTGNSLNSSETILTTSNVNSSEFGMLGSFPLPAGTADQVYAQPLYVPNLTITAQGTNNGVHNVVIVATEENNVYAFDTTTFARLWSIQLGTAIPHNTTIPNGPNFVNFTGDLGVTGTPVIDSNTDIMYLDSAELVNGVTFVHKIFGINITDGATVSSLTIGNVLGGILPKVAGNTPDAVNGTITFSAGTQLQRPGLTILNGVVYVGYGSYGNYDPYHGWVLGFSESSLALTAVFNDVPNEIPGQPNLAARAEGSIWQSGAEITTDGTDLYLVSGNGIFDAAVGDYGESAVKLQPTSTTSANPTINGYGLAVADYFAPSNANVLGPFQNDGDLDLGTSGTLLLPTQPGSVPNEEIVVSKEGVVYLLNRDNMGQNHTTDQIVQELSLNGHGMWGTPTFYDGNVYFHSQGEVMEEFSLSAASATSPALLSLQPIAGGSITISSEGATPVISSNGATNGVVWEIDNTGVLRAYDPTTLQQIYSSTLGSVQHFAVPTVANGQVFAAGAGFLDVFEELPNPFTLAPAAPTSISPNDSVGDQITVSWQAPGTTNETMFLIERSPNGTNNFTQIGTTGVDVTSFTDTNVTPGTVYFYRVRAANPAGDSAYSPTAGTTALEFTNPVDFYRFDELTGSTTADSGFGGATGTLTGTVAPAWAAGYSVGSLNFRGNTFQSVVQVSNSVSNTLDGNASIDLWIKTTQTGNNDPTQAPAILGVTELNAALSFPPTAANTQDAGNDIRWAYIDASGHVGIAVDGYKAVPNLASAALSDPGDTYGVTSTSRINDGQWHNIAFTRNYLTGLLQVYVDGVLQASFLADTGFKTTSYNFIGEQIEEQSGGTVTGGNYFNGQIDELRIYNQVLNAGEIALLAQLPASPQHAGAVAISGTKVKLTWTNMALAGTTIEIDRRIGTSGSFSFLTDVSGTANTYTDANLAAGTTYFYELRTINSAGDSGFTNPAVATPLFSSVVATNIFYNDSSFDGDDPAANLNDQNAFATDKTALLPGQTATFANYTSYVDGINGIDIDISGSFITPLLADFTFMTGNSSNLSQWTPAAPPDGVTVLGGDGLNDSTRVEFTWNASDSVQDGWLQITVAADTDTNMLTPYVFYFGNEIGDTGDSATDTQVTAADETGARNNQTNIATSPAPITDPFDFNRDGNVDATDEIIARASQTTPASSLQLITAPSGINLLPADESAGPSTTNLNFAVANSLADSLAAAALPSFEQTGHALPAALAPAAQSAPSLAVLAGDPLWLKLSPVPHPLTAPADSMLPAQYTPPAWSPPPSLPPSITPRRTIAGHAGARNALLPSWWWLPGIQGPGVSE